MQGEDCASDDTYSESEYIGDPDEESSSSEEEEEQEVEDDDEPAITRQSMVMSNLGLTERFKCYPNDQPDTLWRMKPFWIRMIASKSKNWYISDDNFGSFMKKKHYKDLPEYHKGETKDVIVARLSKKARLIK